MSETHLWSFYFKGVDMPEAAVALLRRLRAGSGLAEEGLIPEELAPGASLEMRAQLHEIVSICARGGTCGFLQPTQSRWFYWDFNGALHDDLALQSFEIFFAWLCRFSPEDQFLGVETVMSTPRPTLLYAIDRRFVSVGFERGDLGALAGPFGASAIAACVDKAEPSSMPLVSTDIEIPGHQAELRRIGWDELCQLMG